MPSGFRMTIVDHNGETSTVGLSGVNFTSATYDTVAGDQDTLQAAIEAIILGNPTRVVREAEVIDAAGAPPATPWAQREVKWLVMYHDTTTGENYRREIPTADLELLSAGTEILALDTGVGLTFKQAFEAYVRSDAGNVVAIDRVVFVARDL